LISAANVPSFAIIDVFGKIGENPADATGSSAGNQGAWSTQFPYSSGLGELITQDHSMIRKSTVLKGVTVNPSFFNGLAEYDTIPAVTYLTDSNGDTLRIEDGSSTPNVYNTYVNVLQASKNVNGITIDLNNTNINIYTTLTLLLTFSLTNGSVVCGSSRTVSSTTSTTPCVSITLTPLSATSFTGTFSPSVFGANRIITYTVSTYTDAGCTTLVSGSTSTYVNPTQSQLTYTLSSLTTATTYYVRMTTAVGGLTATNCLVQSVKTL
jgi:hypothetical protein